MSFEALRLSKVSRPWPGWLRRACGSFWKSAATTTVGMSFSTAEKAWIMLPPI
jgi:hypothetical protein